MNSSYKIALLGAFGLFALVVGYYVFFAEDKTPTDPDSNLAQTMDDTPPTRPTLGDLPAPAPAPAPVPTPTPVVRVTPPEPTPSPDNLVIVGPDNGGTGDHLPGLDPAAPPRPILGDAPRPSPTPTELNPAPQDPTTPTRTISGDSGRPGPGTTENPQTPTPAPIEVVIEPAPRRPIPPSPTPTSPQTPARSYTVKEGDTLSSIAEAVYGDESAWFDIAQANPSVDPKKLRIDQVLVLPDRTKTEPTRGETRPPAPGADQTYTVRPGDTLSKIARQFYNDSEQWDLIYACNRDKIGPRPDNIKVGMVLVIPQAYSGAR